MKILVADQIGEEGLEVLRSCAQVDVKTGLKPDELLAIIGDYEGLVVRSQKSPNQGRVTCRVEPSARGVMTVGVRTVT